LLFALKNSFKEFSFFPSINKREANILYCIAESTAGLAPTNDMFYHSFIIFTYNFLLKILLGSIVFLKKTYTIMNYSLVLK
jgi:hypothetical protein